MRVVNVPLPAPFGASARLAGAKRYLRAIPFRENGSGFARSWPDGCIQIKSFLGTRESATQGAPLVNADSRRATPGAIY